MALVKETTPQPALPPPRTFTLEGLTLDQLEAIHSLLGQVAPSNISDSSSKPGWVGELFGDISTAIQRQPKWSVKYPLTIKRKAD